MLLVAEVFRDRQRGQRHTPARPRRLVHLSIDKHRTREHAGALHFGQELMALAGALADPGKDGDALVLLNHRMDELHHQNSLSDTSTAEHRSLAALCEGREKIYHLDASLEDRRGRGLILKRRRWIVDTTSRGIGWQGRPAVADSADHVE